MAVFSSNAPYPYKILRRSTTGLTFNWGYCAAMAANLAFWALLVVLGIELF